MDLPFCKICGERHRLGFCPEFDEPRPGRAVAPISRPPVSPPAAAIKESADATQIETPPQALQHPKTQAPQKTRPITPEDMKQESMPITKPKFDRNAYQRELMRKRRARP